MLNKQGGPQELAARMVSSVTDGIETITIPKRVELYLPHSFGDNKPLLRRRLSFFDRVRIAFQDPTLRILLLSACALLVAGLIADPVQGWIEGLTVLLAVAVILVITSFNDYFQETCFRDLGTKIDEVTCPVIRDAHEQEVSIFDLVVGDLLIVKTGTILPADGVFIEAFSMKVDESVHSKVSKLVRKEAYSRASDNNGNPFGLAGTMVEEGSGTMLVCAVGKNSSKIRIESSIESGERKTPLQRRLAFLSDRIGQLGVAIAGGIFVLLLIHDLVYAYRHSLSTLDTIKSLVRSLVVAVMLIVVAVPEGLNFAMKLSLSFSVSRMKDQGVLVRRLRACEAMGEVTDVCLGKTGILTENHMSVSAAYVLESVVQRGSNSCLEPLDSDLVSLLTRCICLNSDASLVYVPHKDDTHKGNRMECALLAMLKKWKVDYEAVRRLHSVKSRVPFSPEWKWMGSICVVNKDTEVYVKGAVAAVLPMCQFIYTSRGVEQLSDIARRELLTTVLPEWAEEGLSPIAIAFKSGPFTPDDYLLTGDPNTAFFSKDLTLVAVFGLRDKLREKAAESISVLEEANIAVRIVTGADVSSAIVTAKRCGLLPENYTRAGPEDYTVLEGREFERLVEGLMAVTAGNMRTHIVSNRAMLQKVVPQLKVLAAARPLDKYILVTGLRQLPDRKVAVTGRDSHDAPALRKADLGLGMNLSGAQIAKEMADIVLTDDDVEGIVTAARWGRNIYTSVRKFMQFQLTVNLAAVALSLVSAAVCGQVPIAPVQLVWVNLVMDTFGALALATDSPLHPVPLQPHLLDADLLKTVLSTFLYEMLTLLMLFAFGPALFHVYGSWDEREWSYEGFVHFTLIFNTFVFLQVFNMFNCRCSTLARKNIFSRLCTNKMFLLIVSFTLAAQVAAVELGGEAMHCNSLTFRQYAVCLLLGCGIWAARLCASLVPDKWVSWVRIQQESEGKSWVGRLFRRKAKLVKEDDIKHAVLGSLAIRKQQ